MVAMQLARKYFDVEVTLTNGKFADDGEDDDGNTIYLMEQDRKDRIRWCLVKDWLKRHMVFLILMLRVIQEPLFHLMLRFKSGKRCRSRCLCTSFNR